MEIFSQPVLKDAIVVAVFQQRQPAAAVVRLAEIAGNSFVTDPKASSDSPQHLPHEGFERIGPLQARHRKGLARCQILDRARGKLRHPLVVNYTFIQQLPLW